MNIGLTLIAQMLAFAGLMILIGLAAALGLRRYAIDRASHEARLAALASTTHPAPDSDAPGP